MPGETRLAVSAVMSVGTSCTPSRAWQRPPSAGKLHKSPLFYSGAPRRLVYRKLALHRDTPGR